MKKRFVIFIIFIMPLMISGQSGPAFDNSSDPFCRMIRAVYCQDALSFHSRFRIKHVFETDTVSSEARVTVIKNGTDISFLRIIPGKGDKELLFCNDTAWVADHMKQKMDCLGTTTGVLTQNSMSQYFPFTLFELDTAIFRVKPFWKIVSQSKEYTVISMDMSSPSADISDIRVEFSCYNSSHLPSGILQESTYMKADKIFQEQVFGSYCYPCPGRIKAPEYLSTYTKDLSAVKPAESDIAARHDNIEKDIFLNDIELFDLSGKSFILPERGLILLDLWYVGCPPCMQSAPVIEKLYHEYNDRVHFFSINETDRDTAKIARFKDKMGISFPVLTGSKEKLAMRVNGNGAYPVFLLVDADSRKVLWKFTGYSENLETVIKDAISRQF